MTGTKLNYVQISKTIIFIVACIPCFMAASCDEAITMTDTDSDTENGQENETSCYSPTQNTSTAYEDGSYGCACDVATDEDICVGGAALLCDATTSLWQAVEDGPCMLEPTFPCEGDDVDSADDCLADDAYCIQLADGTWCTGPTSLCEGETIGSADECLMDDAFCYELDSGSWCTGPQAPSCPAGYSPLEDGETCTDETDGALCYQITESLSCKLTKLYTIDECEAAGGEGVGDPGDGSIVEHGCPEPQITLGYIDAGWTEGGLCCR